MKPVISVIVPVYNVEAYLEKCIKSVLGQTFEDLELILVNDGSTDKSGAICDCYKEKDDRVVVVHQENRGISAARNAGLALAQGTYIGFVDSDDWLETDMYEVLLGELKAENADMVQCGARQIFPDKVFDLYADRRQKMSGLEALGVHLGERLICAAVWNKLFKRELVDGIQFQEGKIHEDYYYLYRALLKAETFLLIDYCGYNHIHTNESSITKTGFDVRSLDKVEAFGERMAHLFEIGELALARRAAKSYFRLVMADYNLCLIHGMNGEADRLAAIIQKDKSRVSGLNWSRMEGLRLQLFFIHPKLQSAFVNVFHKLKGVEANGRKF